MSTFYDFSAPLLDGRPQSMAAYRNKVVLVVNVASKCGFTRQYSGLEALWQHYRDKGLMILGFPCNQFGGQEPGTAEEIAEFCSTAYSVSFPLFAKVDVNGAGASPIYAWLKHQQPGLFGTEAIKWNFSKFLLDRSGDVVNRFGPETAPEALAPRIERLLPDGTAAKAA